MTLCNALAKGDVHVYIYVHVYTRKYTKTIVALFEGMTLKQVKPARRVIMFYVKSINIKIKHVYSRNTAIL